MRLLVFHELRSLLILISLQLCNIREDSLFPIVVNTWNFLDANKNAFQVLKNGHSALDAVEAGCQTCQILQCDGTVGYGGSPDETSETTLDAMIMDGCHESSMFQTGHVLTERFSLALWDTAVPAAQVGQSIPSVLKLFSPTKCCATWCAYRKTMNVGAVGALRRIKNAVSVARYVLKYTQHSFLVGSQATRFAIEMGFPQESLSTNTSKTIWKKWRHSNCQPNFWTNMLPDPREKCGPYVPNARESSAYELNLDRPKVDSMNHDTIGMVAIDVRRDIAVATSTNGASHKIPGRVGDSPIIGAGAYAENGIGGAAATGDGDILMRFLPSFKAIESLRQGLSANASAEAALSNIVNYHRKFVGAVVVVAADGHFGAACHGIDKFPFSVSQNGKYFGQIFEITCMNNDLDTL